MKSRSSASIASGSQWYGSRSSRRCHQWSRPSVMFANDSSPGEPERRWTTMTWRIEGHSRQRLVGEALERQHLSAPVAAVGGDERDRLRVVDPVP